MLRDSNMGHEIITKEKLFAPTPTFPSELPESAHVD